MNNFGTLYSFSFGAIDQDPLDRKQMREKIAADTEQFLKCGNQIKEGPELIRRPRKSLPVYWGQNEGNA